MLPKHARIKKEADFKRIYHKGSRLGGRFFDVFFLPTHHKQARFGIVVATKIVAGAVLRNKNKRLIRSFVTGFNSVFGFDIVIRLKEKIDVGTKEGARKELSDFLKRIQNAQDR